MKKAEKARALALEGMSVIDISRVLKESPYLVAQWVKRKK